MAGPAGKQTTKLVRPCLNVMLMMDTITGRYLRGKYGFWYLNGGLHNVTGYAGRGNTWKSTFGSHNILSAMGRYVPEFTEIYDCEISYQIERANDLARSMGFDLDLNQMLDDGSFNICSSIELPLDDWWKVICNEYDKRRAQKKGLRETVFYNRDGSPVEVLDPWLYFIDSITMAKTSSTLAVEDKSNAGSKETMTLAMRSAGAKSQIISQMAMVCGGMNTYLSMVSHAGDGIKLDQYAPSNKKLAGFKGDIKLKGVPENFTFLTNNLFIATAISPLLDKDKMPEYSSPDGVDVKNDTDLMIVRYEQLRGKGGPTGKCLDLIFSQRDGLQVELSEFYQLNKILDSFGVEVIGNNAKFKLKVYPEVTFSRKNIRDKIREDAKFRRAMEITYELADCSYARRREFGDILVDAEVLREKVEEFGIKWDYVLSDSVYYWNFTDNNMPQTTLTVPTLLEFAAGKWELDKLKKMLPAEAFNK